MLRTAEPTSAKPAETGIAPTTNGAVAAAPAVNGHHHHHHPANGAGAEGNGCCSPPLEAAWLERVETSALRRTPGDVEPADVLPSSFPER